MVNTSKYEIFYKDRAISCTHSKKTKQTKTTCPLLTNSSPTLFPHDYLSRILSSQLRSCWLPISTHAFFITEGLCVITGCDLHFLLLVQAYVLQGETLRLAVTHLHRWSGKLSPRGTFLHLPCANRRRLAS